jgi:hypothetical protein
MCDTKRFRIDELIEGVDFNWKEVDGLRIRVFTKEYLLMVRPSCCKSGCINCPWDYTKKPLE